MKLSTLNSKSIWTNYSQKQYVPIYFQPWWMDCVCGADNWGVSISLDQHGEVEGALVYYLQKRYGLWIITSPPFTTYSGLWLHPKINTLKPSTRMAAEKKICNDLLSQLPPYQFFYQQWHPQITNWLPYHWKGFRQTTYFTYISHTESDQTKVLEKMNKSARKRCKKGATEFAIEESEDSAQLFELYQASLKRRGILPKSAFTLFNRLDGELAKRAMRKILFARSPSGEIVAGQYLIMDEHTIYAHLGGILPNYRNTGAWYAIFDKALTHNNGAVKAFDFEGSMIEGVEEFLRSFGGTLTPHFQITRASNHVLDLLFQWRTRR